MDDPFDTENRNGQSNIEKTIRGLSNILAPRVTLLDTPLVMRSYGPIQKPVLEMEAPYFKGRPIKFLSKFNQATSTKDNFCFLIIANSFKRTFTSHALVGWWNKGILTLFDPNGDFFIQDQESVYTGFGYFIAPQRKRLKNPLYNTLLDYFKNIENIRVYTAKPIPCPKGESRTCAYRSIMYIVATGLTTDPVKVVQYTSKLVKTKFNVLKEIVKKSSLNVANDGMINNLFETNLNTMVNTSHITVRQLPPPPPRTQPLPLRPLRRRRPGTQTTAAS